MLEWREHIVQPPKCTDGCVLFAATRRVRCKHIVCIHCYTAQPSWSTLSGEGLRRQVIRARCLQPGRTTTASSNVYFGCCRTLLATTNRTRPTLFVLQASGGASASWDSIIRPSQVLCMYPDSSGLGNSNCGSCILGNSNHKRPVVAPKPTNFELITKDYHEHKSRLQIFIDST